jgi:hypothetical protein
MQPLSDPSCVHWPFYHWPLSKHVEQRGTSPAWPRLRIPWGCRRASLTPPLLCGVQVQYQGWSFMRFNADEKVLYLPTGFVSLSSKRPSWDYYHTRRECPLICIPEDFEEALLSLTCLPSSHHRSYRDTHSHSKDYVSSSEATPTINLIFITDYACVILASTESFQ